MFKIIFTNSIHPKKKKKKKKTVVLNCFPPKTKKILFIGFYECLEWVFTSLQRQWYVEFRKCLFAMYRYGFHLENGIQQYHPSKLDTKYCYISPTSHTEYSIENYGKILLVVEGVVLIDSDPREHTHTHTISFLTSWFTIYHLTSIPAIFLLC